MITKIVLPVVAVLFILYVTVSILTSSGSVLSEAMIYLAAAGLVVGLLNARMGMMFVFLSGSYLDFFKRFLVISGSMNFMDVIKTLAVAPVTMAGVYAGVLVGYSRRSVTGLPVYRLILALTMAAAVMGSTFASGQSLSGALQTAANSAFYVLLVVFAGAIYQTTDDQHKLFRALTWLFVPVMIYGWWQLLNGYSAVEVAYARSGFTVSTQPLLHPKLTEYKRVFSTMNSSGAFSLVGSILSIYALIFGLGKGGPRRFAGIVVALVFLASQIPGAGRTSWVIVLVTYFGFFIFQNATLTKATYATSIIAVTFFLVNADAVGRWLVETTTGIAGSSDFSQRATNMGTYITRTMGITEWMTNPRYFSLFGLPRTEIVSSRVHDLLGQIYVTTGAVGLGSALIVTTCILVYLHKKIFALKAREDKRAAAFYMANIFAALFSGIFSGSQLHIFPLNVYFWTMVGFLFQVVSSSQKAALPARENQPMGETARGFTSRRLSAVQ